MPIGPRLLIKYKDEQFNLSQKQCQLLKALSRQEQTIDQIIDLLGNQAINVVSPLVSRKVVGFDGAERLWLTAKGRTVWTLIEAKSK